MIRRSVAIAFIRNMWEPIHRRKANEAVTPWSDDAVMP
jgi:hypothetical protein